ncbi:TetR/AcrR family transcriptional regulator [uncultured Ruegeria sp.]|uniref:TetR/AcrR family transcriptional regulator n=1 Tax=uncultured Ruegeria sp. TaxID=259304 RepID=UPI00260ABA5C|nr:TetR/AcrR family transcriptional regulator [uncultured Ruegeria sp.]
MPRPSLKDQRSEQILDAYLTCVSRFGLEGATQERIATEAGVKRPILRHYLGNKDQMTGALISHVVERFAQATTAFRDALEPTGTTADLIDLLFDKSAPNDPRVMLAYQSLVTSVVYHPSMRQPLVDSLEQFFEVIEVVLKRASPNAPTAQIRAVSQGISATYVNLDSLAPLNPPEAWRAELKQAATILAASLEVTV